jgi:festuclavine dehydrogenase
MIPSATGDGGIGLISTRDIAELAASALTDAMSHNDEYYMVGPELITYDQV